MTKQFDLVVIGASFAGLACARTAAMRGLNVAIVDSKPDVGVRVRTTGILVKEVTDAFDFPSDRMRKIRGVRLYAPSGRHLDLYGPGYFFQATDTAGLLRWLACEAERAGARLFLGQKFQLGYQDATGITIPAVNIRADYLIGADGARSRVAQVFDLGRNRRFLAGLELEATPIEALDPRFLHCFADSSIAPGYIGWAFAGCGLTQFGAAAVLRKRPRLDKLIARAARLPGFKEIHAVERRSGLIPTGGPVSPLGRGRVLLIGDAAGLVSPLTGGGIHTALQFGRRAAQLVSDYLYDRGPDPIAAFAREVPNFRAKRILRRALDAVPPNRLIDLLLMTAPARSMAERIFFHRRGGRKGEFEVWQEEFARKPVGSAAAPYRVSAKS
ncbi:MAG TPA: NAD(P)/FAD-dependent oxidoreductase [Rhizomicrobium sp.]|nr:NAD(P)/FAD-dependent oxidoreductase [Rhizomicrobium sp.]